MCLYYNTVAFKKQYPAILFWRGLTHMRSMCVGVAETGGDFKESGKLSLMTFAALFVSEKREKKKVILCFFSFRVLFACPKRTKRTKRGKNSSFEHLLSPRGDQCEHTSPTVRQLLNHGYRFETLKCRLGFTAVPCRAMANLAVQVWVRVLVRT